MTKRELAVQLFTLRNETAQDFPGVLQQVAEAGVSGVEFAGFGTHTAAALRTVLDTVGLVAAGAHIGLNQLQTRLDGVIEDIQTLGAHNLACPGIPPAERPTTADGFRKLAEQLAGYGERCKAAGLQLSYHNHDWEFQRFADAYAIDIMMNATDPELLKLQPDLGWVAYAGVDQLRFCGATAGACRRSISKI